MKNARDDTDMQKFMEDLSAVDVDDLEDDFRGVAVDDGQWEKYQTIVRSLLAAQNEAGGKILKINYLDNPDPRSAFASAMIVMPSAFWFDGEAKERMIVAASHCDRIAVTTSDNKVRVSFTVSHVWRDEGGQADGY